ncbi:MAG: ATP synthase F1 subunit epsilon [Verrucomicrobia bacterium]|nr:ATP synthase F1 subunit epsilon [Verrucomicrobiota bacterium]
MSLTLEIVTPEARVYSDTIETVVIPTVVGEIGILPGHIPLVTQVTEGELRVTKDGKVSVLVVGTGFAQIDADRVSVLAERAITFEKIDEHAVEAALKRAQDALAAKEALEPAEIERLESVVRFSVAQLGIKRRGR